MFHAQPVLVPLQGFPRDGYDYKQHLRPMGGGTFVWASGEVVPSSEVVPVAKSTLVLPEEVMPSEKMNDRMLDAVLVREGAVRGT